MSTGVVTSMPGDTFVHDDVRQVVRTQLLRLAAEQDRQANTEAAQVPYWIPVPPSVSGHRLAATALRSAADAC